MKSGLHEILSLPFFDSLQNETSSVNQRDARTRAADTLSAGVSE